MPSSSKTTPCRVVATKATPEGCGRALDEETRQVLFGYKLSVSADQRCKLIRQIKITTASEHDTLHLEDVLDPANTSRDVYADKV